MAMDPEAAASAAAVAAPDAATLRLDAEARRAALDTGDSFLLQAPAGSGKTTVLTCRLLALLATVDTPEEILAITFTRKAAAEMRNRVLGALHGAAAGVGGEAPEAEHAAAAWQRGQALGWNLLATPARLRIMTIDAYCQSLCAQLPIATRSGLRLEVAPNGQPLYAAAARRLLERALRDDELVDAAQLLFARLDNDWLRLEGLLVLMLAQRAHWLPRVLVGEGEDAGAQLEARVAASLASVIAGRLEAARALLSAALLERGLALARHAARTLGHPFAAGALRADPADLPRWRLLCELMVTGKGEWRRQWNRNNGFLPEHRSEKRELQAWVAELAALPQALELVMELRALPDAQIAHEDVRALHALSLLLRHAAAELQLEFAAQGRVDFAAVAGAARAGLTEQGQPTDLALRTGNAIRHVLVDEFQDTSFDQFELLGALTAGWENGDGRTLFAVGDPMQSIYQFREAEVGLFLLARERGVGALRLRSLQLRCNFRSAPALIAWVNQHCTGMFPAQDDPRLAAISYLPSIAARTELQGQVQVHAMPDQDGAAEAARVLELVEACRAREPRCSIAVLVQARAHAVPIAAALQAAGIAVRGLRLEPLRERAVARELVSLARALQHAGDRSAWLALLHAPSCGLSLPQLQELCEGEGATLWELIGDAAYLAPLPADTRARLARVRAALAPALTGTERALPLWQRVDRAWLRLGGPAACAEERDLSDAHEFIRALASEAGAERLAGDAFDEFAGELYALPPPAEGAVDILTMHGAKGLEWDVVIVPGVGRQPRGDREPLLNWLELPGNGAGAGSELLLAPIGATGARDARSLAGYIRLLRRARARLERARVLYVAATRARRELHWFGAAPVDAQGELAPRANTPLFLLWPTVARDFEAARAVAASAAPAAIGEPPGPAPSAPWQLPAQWQPQGLPAAVEAERVLLSLRETGAQPEYLWVGMAARAVGTIVHAELQRLAQLPTLPSAPDLAPEQYEPWLAELGVEAGERAAAAGRIRAALAATLADPRGRWLLDGAHPLARSELRLSGIHEGRIANVIIDRLLVDAAGTRWVIDYKTSSHEGGDLEGFLAREELRYLPQLRRYASLVGALTGVAAPGGAAASGAVRVALYFPLLGAFREIDLAAAAAVS
jgi:ATP-dependent exoDNAse (exonuclease V) beta subunit